MELHLVGREPVDQPLGRRESPERVERARLGPGRQRRRLDDLAHVAPGPVHVLGGRDDVDVRRRDPVPLDTLESQVEPGNPGCRQRRPDLVGVRARIQQRPEQHVARDPAHAVDVQDHASSTVARRAIVAAIVPAPNPSSMLTTASAAAHELSIASSAETPPNALP